MPRPMIVKRLYEIVKERDLLVSEETYLSVCVLVYLVFLLAVATPVSEMNKGV